MTTIDWNQGKVRFIDQSLLPTHEVYVETEDYRVVGDAIQRLAIRGAPAIGVAAAFAIVLAVNDRRIANSRALETEFHTATEYLARTRPTAVNLFFAISRMKQVFASVPHDDTDAVRFLLLEEAQTIKREDIDACRRIGENGASFIKPGSSVLTHCNAGALATAGEGTALSVITTAARLGNVLRVYVDETRPLLQGARLTSWELVKLGLEVVLITDNTAGWLMQQRKVDAVIVGADRIAANGDVANKIGTYPLAVLAARHGIPFYVAVPTSTIDLETESGGSIPIEERAAEEVTHIAGIRVAAEGVRVYAPAFDVTPHELVTAIITERGIARAPYGGALEALKRAKVDAA
ncbi:MAG TPA: S-methyl-5-thioribose-1-phosphate isomerase [Bacteroidota bacterium]|nr:S-methyl-5-thioribose-1-phosphate isomerase [Bacteroidota bacterium]